MTAHSKQFRYRQLLSLSFPAVLSVIFYLFLAVAGLIHVYAYNELLDDEGCSIGALFCHGQTEASTSLLLNHPLHFQYLVFLYLFFSIPFILFDFCPQRGPPQV